MPDAGRPEGLLATIQRLSFARDLQAITDAVRSEVRQLTGADGVTFVLRDGDFCHYVAEDAIGPLWQGQRFPLVACISGWVMMRGETRLVEDLLLATYASAGTLRLQLRRIDLSQTCRTISEMIGGLVAAQRLTLRFECEPTVPIVGDAERIQQIAWNLLSNAVKFTPPGGTVQLRIWSRPGWAMLTVRDTGLGIRPDFLEQVFEPFLQGESGTRRRFPGLGLGLHIVRLLAELHGGRVTSKARGRTAAPR